MERFGNLASDGLAALGKPNDVSQSSLRQGAQVAAVYTGNHPGRSMPTDDYGTGTTNIQEGIPDAVVSTGAPEDARISPLQGLLDINQSRWLVMLVLGGALLYFANNKIVSK